MSLDEPAEPEYVKLISKDGQEFIFSRDVAIASSTISTMFNSPARWAETKGPMPTMHLSDISSEVLERVVKYFHYKKRWDKSKDKPPDFDIQIDNVIPLLLAANFLDC